MRFGIVLITQDPPRGENIARVYREAFREAETAEKYGFELAVVGEHHHSPDGYLPSGLTFCAALASRTSSMMLATDVMQLPILHPVHVAEMGSVVDNVSNGRFILGVGLGQKDRSVFGIPKAGIAARFEESIEVIRRAWAHESFSFSGDHFRLENVRVSPRPVQPGGPAIWVGAISAKGLLRAGRIGDGWPTDNLQSLETIAQWTRIYRESAAEQGNDSEVILARSGWVSGSRSDLLEKWWPAVTRFHQPYISLGLFKDLAPDAANWSFQRVAPGRLIAGTPDEVAAGIEECRQAAGCESIIMMFRHPEGPAHEDVVKCIELFGREVIPRFKN